LSPYPAAWTVIGEKNFKVYKTSVIDRSDTAKNAGEFVTDDRNYLYFKTRDGWISVDELQPEGKKKMTIRDFFRGNKL
jgi:methionyl-tRNA formyltransferase